jgi:hypothetical protein
MSNACASYGSCYPHGPYYEMRIHFYRSPFEGRGQKVFVVFFPPEETLRKSLDKANDHFYLHVGAECKVIRRVFCW